MKKRLISMLMAVLMIASLLPASAVFASDETANNCANGKHEYTTVSIKKDTEKKTPGVEVKVCKHCNYIDESSISIKAFALLWNQCRNCEKGKTMTAITATCRNDGLTVSYCEKCGKAFANKDFENKAYKIEAALEHVYGEFKVIEAPKCTTPGYGYAVCKLCGDSTFVADNEEATELLKLTDFSSYDAYKARVSAVDAMFAPTNPNHDPSQFVAVTKKTTITLANGDEKTLYPAKNVVHIQTVNGHALKLNVETGLYEEDTLAANYEKGYTGDLICPICKAAYEPGRDIDHNFETDGGILPYYDAANKTVVNGKADTVVCTAKGCTYTGGKDIICPNEWSDETTAVPATCKEPGKEATTYKRDNKTGTIKPTEGDVIKALGHDYVLVKGEESSNPCIESGWSYVNYKECTRCHDHIGDPNRKIHFNAPGKHDYQLVAFEGAEATCQHKGLSYKECKVCHEKLYDDNGVLYTEVTNMVAHTASDKLANVKEATCTEEGYTGDVVCKFCGEVMKAGEKTKMVDHTPVDVEAKAPTCTEPGISKGTVCKVCEKVLSGQETVPALGHDPKLVNAKDATCTEAGYSGDKVCTRCNVTLEKGKDIKALGHNFVKGVCSRCDAKQTGYNPFSDVKSTDRFYSDIMWAWENGIVEGDNTGMFRADGKLTRAQVVTMLWRLYDKPTAKTAATFTDLTQDWYKDAVAWAVEKGIVNGVGNNKFAPNETCTRAQIVTMLWRLNGSQKVTPTINFTDLTQDWYKDAVAWAANNGITKGDGASHFYPANDCTRGEAVAFIHRTAVLGK